MDRRMARVRKICQQRLAWPGVLYEGDKGLVQHEQTVGLVSEESLDLTQIAGGSRWIVRLTYEQDARARSEVERLLADFARLCTDRARGSRILAECWAGDRHRVAGAQHGEADQPQELGRAIAQRDLVRAEAGAVRQRATERRLVVVRIAAPISLGNGLHDG
jgi:hypothetical protein